MKSKSPQKQLDGFIDRYTLEIAALTRAAFARLKELLPTANIWVYDNYNALVIGFVPNERTSDAILSLVPYPRWVCVFFLQGVGLPDPERLLKGNGKHVRQLILPDAEALDTPAVQDLIAVALERAKVPLDPDNKSQLVIKSISENQRPRRPVPKKPGARKVSK